MGVHAGTVMEGSVSEGRTRPMGTKGDVTVAMDPKDKSVEIVS